MYFSILFDYMSCRYLERIIRPTELEDFASLLSTHQKAITANGS